MSFSMENEIKKNRKLLFSMILSVFVIAMVAQQAVAADTYLQSPQVPANLRVIDTDGDGDVGHLDDPSSRDATMTMPEKDALFAAKSFPGAKGFGTETPGGRGGSVIRVTNLNNDGPGSFREAISASGPRIVIFDIGGTIVLDKNIIVKNPYITIAGQTAPGGGITLRRAGITIVTHDVIMRGIRVRVGNEVGGPPLGNRDALQIASIGGVGTYNIVVDHCSFSWSTDEIFTVWGDDNYNITVSNSIFTEPLNYHGHGFGVMFGPGSKNITFHNNIIAHALARSPRISGWISHLPTRAPATNIEVYNNLVYNWTHVAVRIGNSATDETTYPQRAKFINNYYITGPQLISSAEPFNFYTGGDDTNIYGIYVKGNIGPGRANNTLPEDDIIRSVHRGYVVWDSPFDPSFVPEGDYLDVYNKLLGIVGNGIGAYIPARDSIDIRTIDDIKNLTGSAPDTQDDVGGWPTLSKGTPPVDTDGDGMPDSWEISYGLDPNDPTDANTDKNSDGYTNIETYINSLLE